MRSQLNAAVGFLTILVVMSSCSHVQEEHYPSGKLKGRFEINRAEQPHGQAKVFFESGVLEAEGECDNGVKDKAWRWYDSTGVLRMTGAYNNGVQAGDYIEYFPSGKPKSVISFSNGLREGSAKTFHANGRIASFLNYRSGMLNDTLRFFYPTGVLSMLSLAKNDTVVMYIEYDSTGVKRHEFTRAHE